MNDKFSPKFSISLSPSKANSIISRTKTKHFVFKEKSPSRAKTVHTTNSQFSNFRLSKSKLDQYDEQLLPTSETINLMIKYKPDTSKTISSFFIHQKEFKGDDLAAAIIQKCWRNYVKKKKMKYFLYFIKKINRRIYAIRFYQWILAIKPPGKSLQNIYTKFVDQLYALSYLKIQNKTTTQISSLSDNIPTNPIPRKGSVAIKLSNNINLEESLGVSHDHKNMGIPKLNLNKESLSDFSQNSSRKRVKIQKRKTIQISKNQYSDSLLNEIEKNKLIPSSKEESEIYHSKNKRKRIFFSRKIENLELSIENSYLFSFDEFLKTDILFISKTYHPDQIIQIFGLLSKNLLRDCFESWHEISSETLRTMKQKPSISNLIVYRKQYGPEFWTFHFWRRWSLLHKYNEFDKINKILGPNQLFLFEWNWYIGLKKHKFHLYQKADSRFKQSLLYKITGVLRTFSNRSEMLKACFQNIMLTSDHIKMYLAYQALYCLVAKRRLIKNLKERIIREWYSQTDASIIRKMTHSMFYQRRILKVLKLIMNTWRKNINTELLETCYLYKTFQHENSAAFLIIYTLKHDDYHRAFIQSFMEWKFHIIRKRKVQKFFNWVTNKNLAKRQSFLRFLLNVFKFKSKMSVEKLNFAPFRIESERERDNLFLPLVSIEDTVKTIKNIAHLPITPVSIENLKSDDIRNILFQLVIAIANVSRFSNNYDKKMNDHIKTLFHFKESQQLYSRIKLYAFRDQMFQLSQEKKLWLTQQLTRDKHLLSTYEIHSTALELQSIKKKFTTEPFQKCPEFLTQQSDLDNANSNSILLKENQDIESGSLDDHLSGLKYSSTVDYSSPHPLLKPLSDINEMVNYGKTFNRRTPQQIFEQIEKPQLQRSRTIRQTNDPLGINNLSGSRTGTYELFTPINGQAQLQFMRQSFDIPELQEMQDKIAQKMRRTPSREVLVKVESALKQIIPSEHRMRSRTQRVPTANSSRQKSKNKITPSSSFPEIDSPSSLIETSTEKQKSNITQNVEIFEPFKSLLSNKETSAAKSPTSCKVLNNSQKTPFQEKHQLQSSSSSTGEKEEKDEKDDDEALDMKEMRIPNEINEILKNIEFKESKNNLESLSHQFLGNYEYLKRSADERLMDLTSRYFAILQILLGKAKRKPKAPTIQTQSKTIDEEVISIRSRITKFLRAVESNKINSIRNVNDVSILNFAQKTNQRKNEKQYAQRTVAAPRKIGSLAGKKELQERQEAKLHRPDLFDDPDKRANVSRCPEFQNVKFILPSDRLILNSKEAIELVTESTISFSEIPDEEGDETISYKDNYKSLPTPTKIVPGFENVPQVEDVVNQAADFLEIKLQRQKEKMTISQQLIMLLDIIAKRMIEEQIKCEKNASNDECLPYTELSDVDDKPSQTKSVLKHSKKTIKQVNPQFKSFNNHSAFSTKPRTSHLITPHMQKLMMTHDMILTILEARKISNLHKNVVDRKKLELDKLYNRLKTIQKEQQEHLNVKDNSKNFDTQKQDIPPYIITEEKKDEIGFSAAGITKRQPPQKVKSTVNVTKIKKEKPDLTLKEEVKERMPSLRSSLKRKPQYTKFTPGEVTREIEFIMPKPRPKTSNSVKNLKVQHHFEWYVGNSNQIISNDDIELFMYITPYVLDEKVIESII